MEIVGNVGKTNNFQDLFVGIMEIVGFTNISNNFHDSRNYGSDPRGFSRFMGMVESVGFAKIVHEYILQNGVTEICD